MIKFESRVFHLVALCPGNTLSNKIIIKENPMKRFTTVLVLALIAMAFAAPLFANGGNEGSDQKIVGIAMPTQSSQKHDR